ncbi:MAG: sulfur oxidation c-type cytochrome SoxX [Paracoccaceae bacterium]
MKRTMITLTALVFTAGTAFSETAATDVVFDDGAVSDSLTGVAGDAANGRNVFASRKKGNCLACHQNTDQNDQLFHGEVGPSLDGAADRWTEAELRGLLTNSKQTFEDTIMPSFYRITGFSRNQEKFEGKTILTAQEVEDVLAYLQTLKE